MIVFSILQCCMHTSSYNPFLPSHPSMMIIPHSHQICNDSSNQNLEYHQATKADRAHTSSAPQAEIPWDEDESDEQHQNPKVSYQTYPIFEKRRASPQEPHA